MNLNKYIIGDCFTRKYIESVQEFPLVRDTQSLFSYRGDTKKWVHYLEILYLHFTDITFLSNANGAKISVIHLSDYPLLI